MKFPMEKQAIMGGGGLRGSWTKIRLDSHNKMLTCHFTRSLPNSTFAQTSCLCVNIRHLFTPTQNPSHREMCVCVFDVFRLQPNETNILFATQFIYYGEFNFWLIFGANSWEQTGWSADENLLAFIFSVLYAQIERKSTLIWHIFDVFHNTTSALFVSQPNLPITMWKLSSDANQNILIAYFAWALFQFWDGDVPLAFASFSDFIIRWAHVHVSLGRNTR